MNFSLLYAFTLMLLLSSIFAYDDWRKGDNGLVHWNHNCDFFGHDIGRKQMKTGDKCGSFCIAHPQCTHFTHTGEFCYIKRNTLELDEMYRSGSTCGYIINRIKEWSEEWDK